MPGSRTERVLISYPEGAPLTELKHPVHTVLKLHRAVKLGQVVVIDTQQLKHRNMKARKKRKAGRDRGLKKKHQKTQMSHCEIKNDKWSKPRHECLKVLYDLFKVREEFYL